MWCHGTLHSRDVSGCSGSGGHPPRSLIHQTRRWFWGLVYHMVMGQRRDSEDLLVIFPFLRTSSRESDLVLSRAIEHQYAPNDPHRWRTFVADQR